MGPPPPDPAPGPASPYPLDVGRVAALGSSLYRYRWGTLLVTAALCLLPATLIMAGAAALFAPLVNGWLVALQSATRLGLDPPPLPDGFATSISALLAAGLVMFVASTLAVAAIVRVIDSTYRGETTSAVSAVRYGASRLPALLAAQVLYILLVVLIVLIGVAAAAPLLLGGGVVTFLGLIVVVATVVAVLFTGVRTSLALPAIVVDGVGGVEALARSWRLASGSGWRLFGYLFSLGILTGLAGGVFTTVPALLLGLSNTVGPHVAASTMLEGVSAILLAPVLPIVVTLLYYDLRWRRGEPAPVPGSGQPAPPSSARTF